jgi:hypothetical protein
MRIEYIRPRLDPHGRPILSFLVGISVILLLIFVNQLTVGIVLDTSYVGWYLRNGAIISLVFAFVTIGWGDLNRFPGLTSAHPLEQLATMAIIYVLPQLSFVTLLGPSDSDVIRAQHREWRVSHGLKVPRTSPIRSFVLAAIDRAERITALIFSPGLVLLCYLWVVVVFPLQYFVYLVAGAPARLALRASNTVAYKVDDEPFSPKYDWIDLPKTVWTHHLPSEKPADRAPDAALQLSGPLEALRRSAAKRFDEEAAELSRKLEGARESEYFTRPVTLTASLATLLLYGIGQLA